MKSAQQEQQHPNNDLNSRSRVLAICIQTDFFLYFVIEKEYNT